MKFRRVRAGLFAAILALGPLGCADRNEESSEAALLALMAQEIPCPPARLLAETTRLVVAEGTDPRSGERHPAYEAVLRSASSACVREKDRWHLTVEIEGSAGPIGAVSNRTVHLPVFIAVTEFERTVLDKKVVQIPVTFDPRSPREQIDRAIGGLTVPATSLHPGGGYEVLVGFQLTPEQLERNRHGLEAARPG